MSRLVRAVMIAVVCVAGCAGTPRTAAEVQSLNESADTTLAKMIAKRPALRGVIREAAGYAVFPDIGKGGMIVGGAYGVGVLYERGRRIGTVKLSQASIGAQLGGQSFSELLVLRDPIDVARIKTEEFTVGADASVIALTAGAGASGQVAQGVTAYVMPRGGLMVDVSVAGQQIRFEPAG